MSPAIRRPQAGLVRDLEILAPGNLVGDQNVHTIETRGKIDKRKSPRALGRLAAGDVQFLGVAGGYKMIVEIVEFDGDGGLYILVVVEGDDCDRGSVAP